MSRRGRCVQMCEHLQTDGEIVTPAYARPERTRRDDKRFEVYFSLVRSVPNTYRMSVRVLADIKFFLLGFRHILKTDFRILIV